MKKVLLCALLFSNIISASDYNYEVSPMAGYVFPSGQRLENYAAYGAEFQYNALDSLLRPELSVLWSDADYEYIKPHATDIWRTAVNGVYDFTTSNSITPFAKAGLGYEHINDRGNGTDNLNHNGAFADVGAGVKVGITDQIALKLEAIEMLKFNHFDWDNSLLLMAGINFAFGEKVQPAAPATIDESKPDTIPEAEPETKPVAAIQPSPADSDNDGVLDSQDKCPNTPAGFKVGADGCPLKATLPVHFAFDSSEVDEKGMVKINEFALFMKESPAYDAIIIGHADSTGPTEYNQKLSERRAMKAQSLLIERGIAADRLSIRGEGENMPIATNKTKAGRAENRRIEVDLRE